MKRKNQMLSKHNIKLNPNTKKQNHITQMNQKNQQTQTTQTQIQMQIQKRKQLIH